MRHAEQERAVEGDVRSRLMKAAEQLLAASPSGQVSTREICAMARVTAPTLYHHFADKEALLDAVVLEGFHAYLDDKRAVSWSGDVLEDFRAGWDMHVSFGCDHPAFYRLMFGNPQPGRVPPAAVVAEDEVARTVADWAARGYLAVPVDAAIQTMAAAAVGVTLQLVAAGAGSAHPMSIAVRDTIAGALFRSREEDGAPVRIAHPARRLLDELPQGSATPLRATETALLRDWLHTLADTSRDMAPGKVGRHD